jgi:hypothetical protein
MPDAAANYICAETDRSFGTSEEAQASSARFREIQAECDGGRVPELRIGDIIYLDTDLYVSHGVDDFRGGLAEVAAFGMDMSAGKPTPFVKVVQLVDTWHNWQLLAEQQRKLRAKFGKNWSHPDPDFRPEFNEW